MTVPHSLKVLTRGFPVISLWNDWDPDEDPHTITETSLWMYREAYYLVRETRVLTPSKQDMDRKMDGEDQLYARSILTVRHAEDSLARMLIKLYQIRRALDKVEDCLEYSAVDKLNSLVHQLYNDTSKTINEAKLAIERRPTSPDKWLAEQVEDACDAVCDTASSLQCHPWTPDGECLEMIRSSAERMRKHMEHVDEAIAKHAKEREGSA